MGEKPTLSGMFFGVGCGAELYPVRARGWAHEQEHFVCATYKKINVAAHHIKFTMFRWKKFFLENFIESLPM